MKNIILTLVLLTSAVANAKYDPTWFEMDFWSGEYPNGFSVEKETTVKGRKVTSLSAPQEQKCVLPQSATYHPWNWGRTQSDELKFTTFSQKVEMTALKDFEYEVDINMKKKFKKGDVLTYLIYYSEGMFLVEHNGTSFEASQDLFDYVSEFPQNHRQDEWLQLNCKNGVRTWLYLPDLENVDGLRSPNITAYGDAKDL